MPREMCQSGRLKDAAIRSLCDDCCRKPSCTIAAMTAAVMAGADGAFKSEQIISDCANFLPTQKAIDARIGVWPPSTIEMWKKGNLKNHIAGFANAVDLCEGCPTRGGCDHDTRLFFIRRIASKMGTNIATTTVCCGSGLTQITEPKTGG